MGLAGILFKTKKHQRLAELLWVEGLTASVRELALMSGLPYATAYELLHKMMKLGLVNKSTKGRATLFSSDLASEELKKFKALLGLTEFKRRPLVDFEELDLPVVGELPELQKEKAQSVEEMLVKVVALSKKNPTLLRVLPLLAKRLSPKLNFHELIYWSKRHGVNKELGFVLDLTGELSKDRKLFSLAKKLMDKRWTKSEAFLDSENNLDSFQAMLVEENTPALAKKWFLKMNMGLDSFKSHYRKFS